MVLLYFSKAPPEDAFELGWLQDRESWVDEKEPEWNNRSDSYIICSLGDPTHWLPLEEPHD